MNEYGLSKEDWETIIELGMGNKFDEAMKKIDSKIKDNFTRRFLHCDNSSLGNNNNNNNQSYVSYIFFLPN